MALDVLRAISKTGGESLKAFGARVNQITERCEWVKFLRLKYFHLKQGDKQFI